ncbi:MAG: hypothetical protein WBD66_06490, partial [Candidatus Acidiferrales bacterium]
MKQLLSSWRDLLPLAAVVVLAGAALFFWLRRSPEDPAELERQRRAYLNRVGRIVEGQVLEIVDHSREPQAAKSPAPTLLPGKRPPVAAFNGAQKLLYYTYSISGVTYE